MIHGTGTPFGVSIGAVAYQRYGVVEAFRQSVAFNVDITKQTFQVLGKIFTGKLAAKSALSGPIEIAAMSGAAVRSGFRNLLYLMGVISISIAILNLLPIPVLDGGQIVYQTVELVKGSPLSEKFMEQGQKIGLLILLVIMSLAFYVDLNRFLG